MIEIILNGKASELDQPMSFTAALEMKGFGGFSVAFAINPVVVRPTGFGGTLIDGGVVVEIARPVGGGL